MSTSWVDGHVEFDVKRLHAYEQHTSSWQATESPVSALQTFLSDMWERLAADLAENLKINVGASPGNICTRATSCT
jgi:hypothetical protein